MQTMLHRQAKQSRIASAAPGAAGLDWYGREKAEGDGLDLLRTSKINSLRQLQPSSQERQEMHA